MISKRVIYCEDFCIKFVKYLLLFTDLIFILTLDNEVMENIRIVNIIHKKSISFIRIR